MSPSRGNEAEAVLKLAQCFTSLKSLPVEIL